MTRRIPLNSSQFRGSPKSKRRPGVRTRQPWRLLRLEPLEDRRLLAVDAALIVDFDPTFNVVSSNSSALVAEGEGSVVAGSKPSEGTASSSGESSSVKSSIKIASGVNGGPTLGWRSQLGTSLASPGDLNEDGVTDLAVGAPGSNSLHVFFMNSDGTVKNTTLVTNGSGGGPMLESTDLFGSSMAPLGDLDEDGVADLAVGAPGSLSCWLYCTGDDRGAVHVLFMNSDGTVKSSTKIGSDTNGGPILSAGAHFGGALASLGDLDGDGVTDLAVGASSSTYILFMKPDGRVKSTQQISGFGGNSVASPGDLNGDAIPDLAIATPGLSASGFVHAILLNADGTVKSSTSISSGTNGGPALTFSDYFGGSVAAVGDLDGDGVTDLAAGALLAENGNLRAAVYVLFMNPDGTAHGTRMIAGGTKVGFSPESTDEFGLWVESLGDLDHDGVTALAVGAPLDDTGNTAAGAVYVLFLNSAVSSDTDNDHVDNDLENMGPNQGDGNRDGVLDGQQAHVASLPSLKNGTYVSLAGPNTTSLGNVSIEVEPPVIPALNGITFPVGFLDYELTGLTPGGSTTVTIYLEDGAGINTFYKFGPTPKEPTPHWYRFMFDGRTGAEFFADRIVLHFIDGQRGDDDLAANGTIADPGGPAADARAHPWQNPFSPLDVNDDRRIDEQDALVIINRLNQGGPPDLPVPVAAPNVVRNSFDVSGNNVVEALDVLLVINDINAHGRRDLGESDSGGLLAGEGEAGDQISWVPAPGSPAQTVTTQLAPVLAARQENMPLSDVPPQPASSLDPVWPVTGSRPLTWDEAVDDCFAEDDDELEELWSGTAPWQDLLSVEMRL